MIHLGKILGFFVYPVLLLITHVFLILFGLYRIIPELDIIVHFLGGVAIGYTFILIIGHFEKEGFIKISSRVVPVVSLVAFAAVLWEIFELFLTYLTGMRFVGDFYDTSLDLFFGILGGVFITFFKGIVAVK
ncbi:MAG: hypothetical protein Q8P81_04290 [Nanoarchaeota archaeon]|nr:hypothetical protein [Nanoarchaeota archaeon]